MPISDGFKAIGPAWASSPTADRIPPNDNSLMPPIVVAEGWPESFSDDEGTGAAGTAAIAGGAVSNVNVTAAGINYASAPSVVFEGGGGTGARATATVSGGSVTGVTVDEGGIGFTSAPTVLFLIGISPRRAVFNEVYNRRDSALLDVRNYGILPWDVEVDTIQGGVKQVNGRIYSALVNNGPSYSNAISPIATGQTVWEIVSGAIMEPAAPDAPSADVGNGQLVWVWNCPLDGGAVIDHFDFQWRVAGGSFSASIEVTTPRYVLSGITNDRMYEARARANNAQGDGPWSSVGSQTPQAVVPDGGATLALRADPGDTEVDLTWLEPNNGGASIPNYTVQWRSSGQMFSSSRQATVVGTTYTRTGLTNDTEYFFQVRANNSRGSGPWSNEASATPEAVAPPPPADTAPSAPTALAGTPRRPLIVDWTWELPNSNGGQRVASYDFQWRYSGNTWSGNLTTGLERSSMRTTVADTTRAVQARVRATNSVDASVWASTVTVAATSLLGHPTQAQRFTLSQTWSWPYDDLDRASVLLYGLSTIERLPSRDINLDDESWTGGLSDGTTIWFVRNDPGYAVAYTASTRARNSSLDIDLGTGTNWSGGVSDGTTLWFINNASGIRTAVAYTASTRARNSSLDIDFSPGNITGGVFDGTTLWLVESVLDVAMAYNASTRMRDNGRDIPLGTGTNWSGGVSDGTTLWFINATNGIRTAVAYTASTRARNSSLDIDFSPGNITGGVSDGTTLWFINTSIDTTWAYSAPALAQLVTAGNTYTTVGDTDGVVTQALTGIANNQNFVFTFNGPGFAEVYPQS